MLKFAAKRGIEIPQPGALACPLAPRYACAPHSASKARKPARANSRAFPMDANDAFHIAVNAGDGIGTEGMAPAPESLRKLETSRSGLKFRFTEAAAGATHYRQIGTALPDSTVKLCDEADAILLGACGLPDVRYPDGTEIAPQIELRKIFDLYAGVRPARLVPGVARPILGAQEPGIALLLIPG